MILCPDENLLEKAKAAPERGKRLLFFSGGSALRDFSRELVQYTQNSIHLVTPFDSGGSSQHLRKAFDIFAVGDLRNRVLALAEAGHEEMVFLLSHRLSGDRSAEELRAQLEDLVEGNFPKVRKIEKELREKICSFLRSFAEKMPADFDLREASVGNLMLVGAMFELGSFEKASEALHELVSAQGRVFPVSEENLHLGMELDGGKTIIGQHGITALDSNSPKNRRLFLNSGMEEVNESSAKPRPGVTSVLTEAELICYGAGSFFTSLCASLTPEGLGAAISQVDCPKVYVPNFRGDKEQRGMSVADEVAMLKRTLRESEVLTHVLLDQDDSTYDRDVSSLEAEVIRLPLSEGGMLVHRNLISALKTLAN